MYLPKSTSFVPAGTDLAVKLLTVKGLAMGGGGVLAVDRIEFLAEKPW